MDVQHSLVSIIFRPNYSTDFSLFQRSLGLPFSYRNSLPVYFFKEAHALLHQDSLKGQVVHIHSTSTFPRTGLRFYEFYWSTPQYKY